jgi:two-component system, LytTR family, response regulator
MLSCLIIEDEPLARNLLTEYVAKVPSLSLLDACASPLAGLEILRREKVDVLFLDIQMPEISGISLLKTLQVKPMVILTTAYSQYALEGYELDVVDYLLKPVTFERFLKAVEKVNQRNLSPTIPPPAAVSVPDFVFVKDGTKHVRVELADILYVEGLKDYVTIHTKVHKIVTLQRLKSLEEQLPADRFIRIHHSYIIATHAIDAVQKSEVRIGSIILPVSESYRKALREFIDRNQIG